MPEHQSRAETTRPEHRVVRWLRELAMDLLSVGSVLACVAMIILFGVGFWVIGSTVWANRSAWLEAQPLTGPNQPHPAELHKVIVGILQGLEFFLLAPLPALVFLSLARFFRSFQRSDTPKTHASHESQSHVQLHQVKALIVSLMTASLATDLLGKALQGMSLDMIGAECLVLVLLGMYWLSLERLCSQGSPRVQAD